MKTVKQRFTTRCGPKMNGIFASWCDVCNDDVLLCCFALSRRASCSFVVFFALFSFLQIPFKCIMENSLSSLVLTSSPSSLARLAPWTICSIRCCFVCCWRRRGASWHPSKITLNNHLIFYIRSQSPGKSPPCSPSLFHYSALMCVYMLHERQREGKNHKCIISREKLMKL